MGHGKGLNLRECEAQLWREGEGSLYQKGRHIDQPRERNAKSGDKKDIVKSGPESVGPIGGLLSVYMVKWKLLMRYVTLKGKSGGWKSTLDQEEEEFRWLLWDLDELRKIRFPRCICPLEGQFRKLLLLVFRDEMPAALWCIWVGNGDNGSVCCRLVTGKTQVAPRVKIAIPRTELVAAVNSVRLAGKVKGALKILSSPCNAMNGIREIY